MRSVLIIVSVLLVLIVVSVGGIVFVVEHAVGSRSGPVYRFRLSADPSFLTDDDAARIAREVMRRDGYPDSAWRTSQDNRSKAPDGRPDRFLLRNTLNPNEGSVTFFCQDSARPVRSVNVEMRNGEVVAQGTLGK